MSTYTVNVALAPAGGTSPTHTWTVESGDPADEMATSQVLDGLSVVWKFPESGPYPCQPDPAQVRLQLLVDAATQLDDIAEGDVAFVEVLSDGTLISRQSGRIADASLTPVKRGGVFKARLELLFVDFLADGPGWPKVSGTFPAQGAQSRWAAIGALLEGFRDAGVPRVPNAYRNLPVADEAILLDEVTFANASVMDLFEDTLRQIADVTDGVRRIMFAETVYPTVDNLPFWNLITIPLAAPSEVPYGPAVLALAGGLLGLSFDGASPSPAGLTIDTGRIDAGVRFASLKFDATRKVTVSGSFGTVSAGNGLESGTELTMTSDLTSEVDATKMAAMYLPQPFAQRWILDAFTWYPTDAELTALDYPLNVPSHGLLNETTPAGYAHVWSAPVAIEGIPAQINPGNDSTFYPGTLAGLTLTIRRGKVIVTGQLARRLNTGPDRSATVADVIANFPTVKVKTGADVVDPTLSVYESKLSRKM